MAMRGQLTNGDGYGAVRDVAPGASPLSGGVTDALYVSVTGDVAFTTAAGDNQTFVGVPAHTTLPFRVTHVTAGTTATVKALYW